MWIDGHLDLAYAAVTGRDLRVPADGADACVSLPDLAGGGVAMALATIYTAPAEADEAGYPSSDDLDAAEEAGLRQLRVYETLADEGVLVIVREAADLIEDVGDVLRISLLMEGADPIRDPADVTRWHAAGVRLVGLTWSRGTRYAGGNGSGGPLTPAGIDLIGALDDVGIVHDASHLSDAAFDGVLEHAKGPVVATHSNCRALIEDDERHLRDEQIRAIGQRGGVVGLNLFGEFLARDRRATIVDALDHVEHVAQIMGHRRGVVLGSDMDGGFGPDELPLGLEHPRRLDALADGLGKRGWTADEVDGFQCGNWLRFLHRVL